MIFQPQPSFYKDGPDILKLATPSGEKISAKFHPNPEAKYTILFSHGNAEDIGSVDPFAAELQSAGYAVLTYDYRGYGTSEGLASEANTYQDIETAFKYLTADLKIPRENIILHGRSLGAAVAIDLASKEKVGGLIVESGFVSAFRVLTKFRLMPFDRFDNLIKIKNVRCPVLLIHGRKDTLIPLWHGERLFAVANDPKFSFWADQAGHNNLFITDKAGYLRAIKDFESKLAH
jgi:fermentation-respiration switch protein FrsA (DUF1100 family)